MNNPDKYLQIILDCNNNDILPIINACNNGYLDIIIYLYANGADLNKENKDGYTSIYTACINKYLDIVKYLHERGADIYRTFNYDNSSLLHIACMNNDIEMIKYFDKYLDREQKNDYGWSCLHSVLHCDDEIIDYDKQFEIVKYFIEKGANINSVDIEKSSIFQRAIYNKDLQIIKYLYENGADINNIDDNNETPIQTILNYHYIILNNYCTHLMLTINDMSIIQLITKLILIKDKIKDKSKEIYNFDYDDIIDYVNRNNINININEFINFMKLYKIFFNIFSYLVKIGSDCSKIKIPLYLDELFVSQIWHNNTLAKAVYENNIDMVKQLIDDGYDINIKGDDDWTPLHISTFMNREDIVKLLLENGADINAKTNNNKYTIFHLATNKGYYNIINIIKIIY
jgi:ankyrin repeat protein